MNEITILNQEKIQSIIYTIRGLKVMLDYDLASLYGVETRILNQAVKRNTDRFPKEFMFRITDEEFSPLRSQIVISKTQKGGRRHLPYAFTEQGVAMLSTVLRSNTAVKVSIRIINAFVATRRFINNNSQIFQRINTLEIKQIKTDKKVEQILNALESKEKRPKQGIFFDGQIFDAYKFISDLIRSAEKSIIIIDNYIDDTVLIRLAKRKKNVKVTILTKTISKELSMDVKKYNEQYPPILIKKFQDAHDRFMIIDDKTVYHIGASLKDLGKKWFAFSKMDIGAFEMLTRLKKNNIIAIKDK